jgi:hypothetical protein
MILKPSLSFAGPREYRWQGLEVRCRLQKSQWPSSAEPKFTLPSNISQNLNCSTALQSD